MQFKLKKELISGRYFVRVELTEYNDQDKARATKFGIPNLKLRQSNGGFANYSITVTSKVEPFGFYNQDEADQYADSLKAQITELKQKWNSLEDSWSNEETI